MKKIMFNDKFGLTQGVLDGRKTMTRRIIKSKNIIARHWNPMFNAKYCYYTDYRGKCQLIDGDTNIVIKPSYNVGEVVAIAQSYKNAGYSPDKVFYRSIPVCDGYRKELASEQEGWTNKMFVCANLMPHHIRFVDVKAERLQDISDEDCIKEVIYPYYYGDEKEKIECIECGFDPDGFSFYGIDYHYPTPREAFAVFIDRISGKGTWESNPYIFAYTFELVK